MRVFFLAEKPCALFVNGAFLGRVDSFERSAELHLEDNLFLEFIPAGEFLPLRLYLNEETLFSPPQGLCAYHSGENVALYARGFLRANQSLKVLFQTRLENTLLTLCMQGGLQLNLENETGFHLIPLPDGLAESAPRAVEGGFLLEGEGVFALVSYAGEVIACSEGKILSCEWGVSAEVPFHDCLGHTALCEWKNGTLTTYSIRVGCEPTQATYALALFESALIGADCSPFLSEPLQEKAGALREFLGEYQSVVLTDEPTRVGLVYPVRERVFEVRYFQVSVSDGKINNISPA